MATCSWIGNAQATAAVLQATVTGVAVGGTLTATINGKTVTYTAVTGDTTTTAATAWLALLSSGSAPPEIQQQSWANPSAGVITATAKTPGTPFFGMTNGLTFTGAGGCTVTTATLTANSSPSDVGDAKNWLRNGANSLPQTGDDVVVADSSVDLLWNLDALKNVQIASFTRYQSFTATIGLPEVNPAGFYEWRPTYLQLAGGVSASSSSSKSLTGAGFAATLQVLLGFGQGNGPTRERYDFQGYQVNCTVQASGSAQDAYAVRILGSNAGNALFVAGPSVGVAMLPGETASLASASVTNNGTLDLGPGVTFSDTLTVNNATSDFNCTIPAVVGINNSTLTQGTTAANQTLTYPSITLQNGTGLTWLSPSALSLVLQTSSTFDKSQDQRPVRMNALTIDADSCQVNDPYGAITYVGSVVTRNVLQAGPFLGPPGYRVPLNA